MSLAVGVSPYDAETHKKRVGGRLYDSKRLSWSCQLECTRHLLVSHFFFFKSWFHWAITVGSCNGSLMLMRLYSWLTADSTREKKKNETNLDWWTCWVVGPLHECWWSPRKSCYILRHSPTWSEWWEWNTQPRRNGYSGECLFLSLYSIQP